MLSLELTREDWGGGCGCASYQGRDNLWLRVVVAYRPNGPGQGTGTVYAQQEAYVLTVDIDDDPRDIFFSDLINNISKWQEEGDQIILLADINDDIRGRVVRDFFNM